MDMERKRGEDEEWRKGVKYFTEQEQRNPDASCAQVLFQAGSQQA